MLKDTEVLHFVFFLLITTDNCLIANVQEFFFDNVLVEDLDEKCLAITVYHQSTQKLQKDIAIGDLIVSLKNLSELRAKKEVKIVEELKYHINSKVNISLCFLAPSIFIISFYIYFAVLLMELLFFI